VIRQKVGMHLKNRTIAVLKCIATVDHAGSRFWYYLLTLLGKL
jgi:hypothetical protein